MANIDDKNNFSFDEDDFDIPESENLEETKIMPPVTAKADEAEAEITDTAEGEKAEDTYNAEAETDNSEIQGDEDMGEAVSKRIKKHSKKKASGGKKKSATAKKIRVPLIVAGAVLLGAAVGLFAYSLSTIDDDRVMNNVYIEDLNVSGMTYDETLEVVGNTFLFENEELTLTDGNTTFTIAGADIGLSAMAEETAQKAFNYCKDGNIFQNGFNACMLLFKEHVIIPAPQLESDKLDEKLNECGNAMLGERIQHYAEFPEENTAIIHSGKTGYDGDFSTAREQVLTAMDNEQFHDIRVDFKTAPPDDMTLENLDLLIYKDPVDARYEINGNEVSIIESETGRYIDKEAVAQFVPQIYEGSEDVAVPYLVSEPAVSSQTLHDKLFANTLSSYSTSYGGSTENRKANVARAASLISGTVVAPGEVFSFNDTVGHRTRENGFYTAKEYINGESVDGIGGGTCQVSSTLYSAVLYADMGIVERLNHMMTVGYIPLGQDATVSDGGVDFKFKNTSDYPVKIAAYTNGSTITVSIIGTAWEPARRVSISNNSSQVGENTVVRSTRYVYSGDTLISTDSLNSSTYMPHKKSVAEQEAAAQASAAAAAAAADSSSSSSSNSNSYEDEDDDNSSDSDYDTDYDSDESE